MGVKAFLMPSTVFPVLLAWFSPFRLFHDVNYRVSSLHFICFAAVISALEVLSILLPVILVELNIRLGTIRAGTSSYCG
jgi:hypothetical protein